MIGILIEIISRVARAHYTFIHFLYFTFLAQNIDCGGFNEYSQSMF